MSQPAHTIRVDDTTHVPLLRIPIRHDQPTQPPTPACQHQVDAARLRELVTDLVTAAYHAPPPDWLTDTLWARLTAETPKPDTWERPTTQEASLW